MLVLYRVVIMKGVGWVLSFLVIVIVIGNVSVVVVLFDINLVSSQVSSSMLVKVFIRLKGLNMCSKLEERSLVVFVLSMMLDSMSVELMMRIRLKGMLCCSLVGCM